ncbi:hypothetical protein QTO34_004401 [Cnephaeus nilssonii]|uniref:60S ribosomal protein L21 n=1 Tax=Cnephaeus nilssonii TaxID=3371016 RepID=A0AA40LIH7_CNENI|nr:hypothetical protein QTO34_004401 [Eptesicus nilssonii]
MGVGVVGNVTYQMGVGHDLEQLAKMTNTQAKRRDPHHMLSRPFRKHGVVPLATSMQIYEKVKWTSREWALFKKERPTRVSMAKLGVYSVTQHAVGIVVTKQVKGKVLAKRMNVRIEHIKHSKSRASFLKRGKENDQKRRKPERKVPGFSWSVGLLHPENQWKGA